MKFFYATWALADYQGRVLTKAGIGTRLLSFAEVRNVNRAYIREYVERGYVDIEPFKNRVIREAGPDLLSRKEAMRLRRQQKRNVKKDVRR